MKESLPLGPLLLTVFTSILEVFLLCLAGYILASKGILDKKTQKQLNRLNVSLFTPALLFSKVAFFLSPEKLRELWIIPIFFVVVTVVSMAVSYILGTIFRLKKSQRAFAMAASMFMNSNSLPIALMQSLVVTVHGLKWSKDDNKNAMLGRALTYLVLYSTLGMILRWSYGVRLLSQADDEGAIRLPDDTEDPLHSSQETFNEPTTDSEYSATAPSVPSIVVDDTHTRPQPARKQSKFYNSFPNSPNQSRVQLPSIESAAPSAFNSDDDTTDDEAGTITAENSNSRPLPIHHHSQPPASSTSPLRTFFRRCKRRAHRAWVAFNEFMTVPLWAALLSIIVALIQPVQHALEMHMQPVKGALTSAGNCSIPVTLIVLGAYFYPTKDEKETTIPQQLNGDGTTASMLESSSTSTLLQSVRDMFHGKARQRQDNVARPGETKTVIIAVASRMILTPLLLLPFMAFSAKFDIQRVFDDPVFVVSNVLLISSPPALTLAQITQAASGDAFERLISRTIFWSYCIVTPPATIIYIVIGLLLAKL
ncbi:hypothetical protein VNI00_012405 [Paramarasmius palmivorus]|uniref:PIN-like protein n=1 Tax=Paramarasmius palmivorus TaxID=297713 RepID=A0AAW0C622_9AGAR